MAYKPSNPNGQATMANSEPVVIASDQSAVPVSGTITAELSATDNAVLDAIAADTAAIKTAVEILDNAIAGTEMQVDVVTSALPTGAATSANQSTIIGHLDGVEGLLTTIDADTGNISTKIDTLAGAVVGTELQVDVLTMPTVTVDTHAVTITDGTDTVQVWSEGQAGTNRGIVPLVDNSSGYFNLQGDGNGNLKVVGTVDHNAIDNDFDAPLKIGGMAKSSAPTAVANNDRVNAYFDTTGHQHVKIDESVLPSGAATAANQSTIIGHLDGVEGLLTTIDADTGNLVTIETNTDFGTVTGGGTETGALRVTIANNSTGVLSVDDNGSTLSIDDGGGIITVDGTVAATQSGTWTVQPGNTANTTAWLVSDVGATSGGLSKVHLVSAATTNATNVKASAGQVYAITAFNLNASPRYLKLHNTAGTPTAGSGVTDTFLIPGNTSGAGLVINFDKGIAFSTGIALTIVTGIADTDATAVAANEIVLNIYYK